MPDFWTTANSTTPSTSSSRPPLRCKTSVGPSGTVCEAGPCRHSSSESSVPTVFRILTVVGISFVFSLNPAFSVDFLGGILILKDANSGDYVK
jgi:hypothetical protein